MHYVLLAAQVITLDIAITLIWQIWRFLTLKDIPDDEPLGKVIPMKYFITANQRKASQSTLYFEFQKGRFNRAFWKEDSVYLHADTFDRLGLCELLTATVPDFCYYSTTQISPAQYEALKSTALKLGGEIAALIEELDMWVAECYRTENCFTILGI